MNHSIPIPTNRLMIQFLSYRNTNDYSGEDISDYDIKGCINDPLYDNYENTPTNSPSIPFTIFRDLTEFLPAGKSYKDTLSISYSDTSLKFL